MNELTNKEIEEYLMDLPNSVLDLIQDKTWSKRVDEISLKYSLTEEQDIILKNLVLFVIIGAEEAENFKKSIKDELKISDLLTDQIVNDLDERVFQYAFNQIFESNKEEEVLNVPMASETTPKQTEPAGIRKIDENGLENLRTMESDIESFKNPQKEIPKPQTPQVEYKTPVKEEVKPVENNNLVPNKDNEYLPAKDNEFIPVLQGDNFIPHNLPGVEIDPVQKPINVPRYTADPELIKNEINPEPILEKKENFGSIVGSKLNETTISQKEESKIENVTRPIDPYREPIQ